MLVDYFKQLIKPILSKRVSPDSIEQSETTILHNSISFQLTNKFCIFCYFSPEDRAPEKQLQTYLALLQSSGYQIIFVSTSNLSKNHLSLIAKWCSLIIKRPNICSDFGSIKSAINILTEYDLLKKIQALLITNNSVIVNESQFGDLLFFCENSTKDFSGQTQTCERKLHIQSYFLYFNHSCLNELFSFFQKFKLKLFSDISQTREYVVKYGEVELSQYLIKAGKKFETFIEQSTLNTSSYAFVKKYTPPLIKKNILYLDKSFNVNNTSHFLDIGLHYGWFNKKYSVYDLGLFSLQKINLYSICYDKDSYASDSPIKKITNFENPASQWREFYIFQKMYDAMISQAAGSPHDFYWGFLSWKFKKKTHSHETIFEQAINKDPAFDIYFINPPGFELENSKFSNVFDQGEFYHPGICELTNTILSETGYHIDVTKLDFKAEQQSFCNFFVGNKVFWDKYMQFMNPIHYTITNNLTPNKLPLLYKRADKIINANYISFIIERLFSVFLHIQPSLKVKKLTHEK